MDAEGAAVGDQARLAYFSADPVADKNEKS
jgi:hypothetical protein